MIIEVTQEDIDHGTARSCNNCPIALAIQKRLRDKLLIRVGATYARVHLVKEIEEGGTCAIPLHRAELPLAAINWIQLFDHRRPVTPFSFELPIDHYC